MSIDTYFCFCCLSTNDLVNIYNCDPEENYGNQLFKLFNLSISLEDYEYDGYICKECVKKLKEAIKFKAQVFNILNVLQSNGLIEVTSIDNQMTIKKVLNTNFIENEEKYNKAKTKVVVYEKISQENAIKTEMKKPNHLDTIPTNTKVTQPERDKETTNTVGKGQEIKNVTQYDITDDLKCQICSKELPNVYVYHLHMNQHFPNHICEACGKGFLTEKRLKRHMPSHQTGPFKCPTCEMEFTNLNTLNSHRQRKHGSVALYKCPTCSERFDTLTRRARHLAQVHGRPSAKYECVVCDKKFLLAGNLNAHIRNKHQKVKRHSCPSCRARFAQRQELRAHMAKHEGLRAHACTLCSKRYPRKKALIVHMRTHTDDRRFACEVCGKRFIQKCTLLVHAKVHSREAEKRTDVSEGNGS
ncbi:hypothetical protein ABMA27_012874 [Loxostege sticticalis]|uniref:Uncharacterized protein n=1 Tax=Loxostege sticticalis TaxID=481309 RepID=A0ABR3H0D5_LOXSC